MKTRKFTAYFACVANSKVLNANCFEDSSEDSALDEDSDDVESGEEFLEPKDTILDDWLENTKEIIWVVDSQDGELKENSLFSLTTLDGKRQITESGLKKLKANERVEYNLVYRPQPNYPQGIGKISPHNRLDYFFQEKWNKRPPNNYTGHVSLAALWHVMPCNQMGTHVDIDWMTSMQEILGPRPLNKAFIPGTHCSFTSGTTLESRLVPPSVVREKSDWAYGFFSFTHNSSLLPWSVFTTRDIAAQLEDGVRYFDLKIHLNQDDNTFYCTCHFQGPTLASAIATFKSFAEKFPKEILILDFNTFLNMAAPDHEQCLALLDELEKYVVPNIGASATFNQIWDTERNIIVLYRTHHEVHSQHVWRNAVHEEALVRTEMSGELVKRLNTLVESRDMARFLVTPLYLVGSKKASGRYAGVKELARAGRKQLAQWLTQYPHKQYPNIIAVDFYEKTNFLYLIKYMNEWIWPLMEATFTGAANPSATNTNATTTASSTAVDRTNSPSRPTERRRSDATHVSTTTATTTPTKEAPLRPNANSDSEGPSPTAASNANESSETGERANPEENRDITSSDSSSSLEKELVVSEIKLKEDGSEEDMFSDEEPAAKAVEETNSGASVAQSHASVEAIAQVHVTPKEVADDEWEDVGEAQQEGEASSESEDEEEKLARELAKARERRAEKLEREQREREREAEGEAIEEAAQKKNEAAEKALVEKLEKERQEREQEREQQEKEENEIREAARLAKEQAEREEAERAEREAAEKERERLELERLEQEQAAREREEAERLQRENEEKERLQREGEEKERLQRENEEKERLQREGEEKQRAAHELQEQAERAEAERIAREEEGRIDEAARLEHEALETDQQQEQAQGETQSETQGENAIQVGGMESEHVPITATAENDTTASRQDIETDAAEGESEQPSEVKPDASEDGANGETNEPEGQEEQETETSEVAVETEKSESVDEKQEESIEKPVPKTAQKTQNTGDQQRNNNNNSRNKKGQKKKNNQKGTREKFEEVRL